MKLNCIMESNQQEIWYHVTPLENLPNIKKYGLKKGTVGNNPAHSGDGIYFFKPFTKNRINIRYCARDVADWLGFAEAAIVIADLSNNKLLMDEDTLYISDVNNREEYQSLINQIGTEAAIIYHNYIKERGYDDLAINDKRLAKFKVDLIDRFQIKPYPNCPVLIYRSHYLTCRVIEPVTVLAIKRI